MLTKIGFVGLGTVGRYMAANLAKSQYQLSVFDQDKGAVAELVKLGAKAEDSAAAAAKGKDLVIVIVPEEDGSAAILFGEGGVLHGIDRGAILADMGTHSLALTGKLAQAALERGVKYLEAPVWGSKEHAARGLLTVLAAGPVGECTDVFSYFGLETVSVSGTVGDATRMKLVVSMIQAQMMEALSEGMVLGERLGLKAEKIMEVLDSGGIASPLFHSKGRSIARGDFSRSQALKYVHEQLQQVLELARDLDLRLPAAEAVQRQFQQAVQEGRGDEDFSAVVKLLKR